jgi:hypothetical protein
MNDESSPETSSKNEGGVVIKPWLSGGLVVALVGNFVLSGVLILQLGTFEDARRQAQEVEAGIAKTRTELSTLRIEVKSLRREKDALTPTIVDWEKRVKTRPRLRPCWQHWKAKNDRQSLTYHRPAKAWRKST